MPGNPYDGHTLAEALEQAAILSDIQPEIAVVDRGYKGVAIDGVKVYRIRPRTPVIERTLLMADDSPIALTGGCPCRKRRSWLGTRRV
ncbi:transposase domain protein [Burkholderia oklahomensis]|uniref:Transposase domain protein n=1 Tax=Burkholderia oklahomensis TaxID=342113 RepID=A0AAI8BF10_9BURK|nr:transposase domain protein [Burkholderia oklahomensis]